MRDPDSWWTFRCCELRDGDEPLCTRDPDLGPERGARARNGDTRQDFFMPVDDWCSTGWHAIAVAYGFGTSDSWDRPVWRQARYERRVACRERERRRRQR
ncbi:MAG: hypothetical protein IPK87_10635 [Planctomycetes bacterium]|nr:hypothetical protein [Planctomycetota bacterium]